MAEIDFLQYTGFDAPLASNGGMLFLDLKQSSGHVQAYNKLVVSANGDIMLSDTVAYMLCAKNRSATVPAEQRAIAALWNKSKDCISLAFTKYQIHALAEACVVPMKFGTRFDDTLTAAQAAKDMGEKHAGYMALAKKIIEASVRDDKVREEIHRHVVFSCMMYCASSNSRALDNKHNFRGNKLEELGSVAARLMSMAGADIEEFTAWASDHGHDFAHYLTDDSLHALTFAMIGLPYFGSRLQDLPNAMSGFAAQAGYSTRAMSDYALKQLIPIVDLQKLNRTPEYVVAAADGAGDGGGGGDVPGEAKFGQPASKETREDRAELDRVRVEATKSSTFGSFFDVFGTRDEEVVETPSEAEGGEEASAEWKEADTSDDEASGEVEPEVGDKKEAVAGGFSATIADGDRYVPFSRFFSLPQSTLDRVPAGMMGLGSCISGNGVLIAALSHISSIVDIPNISDISKVLNAFTGELKSGRIMREQLLVLKDAMTPIYGLAVGYCEGIPALRALALKHESLTSLTKNAENEKAQGAVLADTIKNLATDPKAAKNTIANSLNGIQDVVVALSRATRGPTIGPADMTKFALYQSAEDITARKKLLELEFATQMVAKKTQMLDAVNLGGMTQTEMWQFLNN
jgi:hypothetical protein